MPPLFQPASMNKYHTDTQKMHIDKVGTFIDGICSAICSAWSTWQSAATMVGVVINAGHGDRRAGRRPAVDAADPRVGAQGDADGAEVHERRSRA